MNQQLLRIRDIRPDLRSWSVKVLVESKTSSRQSMNSPKRYQRLTLLDEMGDRILATIFDLDINQFERTLSLLDTYIISNARVVLANPDYETYGNTYQWIISHRTVITKELVNLIPASIVVQNFAPFADLQPAERGITVDILAIVIRKFEQRTIGSGPKSLIIHEFAVLTHERRPMMLALWNNVATSEAEFIMAAADPMPIISATKLNVSDHYGVSLGSTPSTTLVVDPPIPEAQRLKIWRANNERAITEALLQVQEIIKRQQLSVQVSARLLTISEVVRAGNHVKNATHHLLQNVTGLLIAIGVI